MDQIGTPIREGASLENRYRIRGLLGHGGMSRVYLADATQLETLVAIKENLQATVEASTQFELEAKMLARLSHPNIPRVIDHFVDKENGRQYLVMDYIEGEDLDSMIKRIGVLPEPMALSWIQQVIDALEYLHSQKPPVIHRDVKPSNIKITPQGKAMLVDFGLAKVYDTRVGTLLGARGVTPGYAPPEQYGMRTSERSDIYAVGATLYTMLTGRTPPEAPLRQSGEENLIPPSKLMEGSVSPWLDRAILGAMALETNKRWKSAGELRTVLDGKSIVARPIQRETIMLPNRSKPIAARSSLLIIGIGAVLGLLVIIGLLRSGIPSQAPSKSVPVDATSVTASSPVALFAAATSTPTTLPPTPTLAPNLSITSTQIIQQVIPVYIPPVMLSPADGAFVSTGNIMLGWKSEYALKSNEVFDVLVWPENTTQPISMGTTKETNLSIDSLKWRYANTFGKFFSTVQVKRIDGTFLSGSKVASFVIVPPPPTPTPTREPIIHSDPPDKPDKGGGGGGEHPGVR